MKNLNWHSIIANYMITSKHLYVYIQTIQQLYKYIEYRLMSKHMDSEYPKLNTPKEAIINELKPYEFYLNYDSKTDYISSNRSLEVFQSIEFFCIDETIQNIIIEFYMREKLRKTGLIQSISYDKDSFKETFILFIENKTYEIEKSHILFMIEFESELTEDMMLFLKYYVDLEYASYQEGKLYIYTNSACVCFKISNTLLKMFISTII